MDKDGTITVLSRHLIDYELFGKKGYVPYNCLRPYINWANKDEIEWISASTIEDIILFAINSHNAQSGLIGSWNIKTKKLEHLTNEPFVYKVIKVDDKLVSLKKISYWGHPVSYDLDEIEYGIMDFNRTSTQVKENIPIKLENEVFSVDYNGKTLLYDLRTDSRR